MVFPCRRKRRRRRGGNQQSMRRQRTEGGRRQEIPPDIWPISALRILLATTPCALMIQSPPLHETTIQACLLAVSPFTRAMRRVYPSRLSKRFGSRYSHAPLRTAPIRPGHENEIGKAKNSIAACRRLQTCSPLYHPRRRSTDILTQPVAPPAGGPAESATPLTSSNLPRAPKTVGEVALGYRSSGDSVTVGQTLHVPLLHSILVSMLDHNQAPPARHHPTIGLSGAARKNSLRVASNSGELDEPASRNDAVSRSFSHADHPIAALCPFEGGEAYIRDAVYRVADEVNANVVRIDLPLALGFEGPNAPLQALGEYRNPAKMTVYLIRCRSPSDTSLHQPTAHRE